MQPGRKSTASIVAVRAISPAQRLAPPAYLSKAEQQIFRDIVANAPAKHFTRNDELLLATFAKVTHQIRQTDDPGELLRAAKTQVILATKLRLTPSSRLDPKTTARAAANSRPSSVYDLMREVGDV
jgi:hypothetical protein